MTRLEAPVMIESGSEFGTVRSDAQANRIQAFPRPAWLDN